MKSLFAAIVAGIILAAIALLGSCGPIFSELAWTLGGL